MLFEVGRAEDYQEGTIQIVQVDGKEIGIVRWRKKLFAIRNICPHTGGPVCGNVRSHLTSPRPGATPVIHINRPVLVCAWHKWEFDLHTATAIVDPKLKIKTYPVSAELDGSVWIDITKRDSSEVDQR
jgi:nitrite reductase/ring-hydroxylating ferredoxin subunit